MDFTRLEYLIALDECRSFSRAAEKCYISQPALTKSINKLEDGLGVKLFDRSKSPISLTYAGERYLDGVRNIMAMKNQLDQEMAEIAGCKRERLRIGIPESRSKKWLGQILPLYTAAYPDVDIQIFESTSLKLEEALIQENVDLTIATPLPLLTPGIDYEPLGSEGLLLVLPPSPDIFGEEIPAAGIDVIYHIQPEHLKYLPFVSPIKTQGLYRAAVQIFDRHGMKPRTLLETVNPSTAAVLASEGLGFSITSMDRNHLKNLLHSPLLGTLDDPPYHRTLIAAWKKGRELSFPAKQLIETTKKYVNTRSGLDLSSVKIQRL